MFLYFEYLDSFGRSGQLIIYQLHNVYIFIHHLVSLKTAAQTECFEICPMIIIFKGLLRSSSTWKSIFQCFDKQNKSKKLHGWKDNIDNAITIVTVHIWNRVHEWPENSVITKNACNSATIFAMRINSTLLVLSDLLLYTTIWRCRRRHRLFVVAIALFCDGRKASEFILIVFFHHTIFFYCRFICLECLSKTFHQMFPFDACARVYAGDHLHIQFHEEEEKNNLILDFVVESKHSFQVSERISNENTSHNKKIVKQSKTALSNEQKKLSSSPQFDDNTLAF